MGVESGSSQGPDPRISAALRFAAGKAQIDEFVALGRRTLLEKGSYLTRLGDLEHRVAFLHTGLVRYHVVVPDSGEDVAKDFSFAPGLTLSFGSAVRHQPARVAVSAVEDCAVTLWRYAELERFFELDAGWRS